LLAERAPSHIGIRLSPLEHRSQCIEYHHPAAVKAAKHHSPYSRHATKQHTTDLGEISFSSPDFGLTRAHHAQDEKSLFTSHLHPHYHRRHFSSSYLQSKSKSVQHQLSTSQQHAVTERYRRLDDVSVAMCRPSQAAQRLMYNLHTGQLQAMSSGALQLPPHVAESETSQDKQNRPLFNHCLEVDGTDDAGNERVVWKQCALVPNDMKVAVDHADLSSASSATPPPGSHTIPPTLASYEFGHQRFEWLPKTQQFRSLSLDKCLSVHDGRVSMQAWTHQQRARSEAQGLPLEDSHRHRHFHHYHRRWLPHASPHAAAPLPHLILARCDRATRWRIDLFN
jgi:hypothetical protein